MDKPGFFERPKKDILIAIAPTAIVLIILLFIAHKYVNPAPPKHLVIATGDGEGDYQTYAKLYQDLFKSEGIDLEIRSTNGGLDNLDKLQDPNSGVDAAFVQDGLGSVESQPDISSLGSLYYEPIWIFYRGKKEINRLSDLKGKKVCVGVPGNGRRNLSLKLLESGGVDVMNSQLMSVNPQDSYDALVTGVADASIFIATATDDLILKLIANPDLHLMSLDQGEALSRQFRFLHHLILPHGVLDLKNNLPPRDVDMIAATATLLVKDDLHPALSYLLLKAASEIHSEPDILEKKNEFPQNKDYVFPLSEEAKAYYKSGTPFWQRYLPFWLATLVERFIVLVIPTLALIIPIIRLIPKIFEWRLKSRFYDRYGDLKRLETQIKPQTTDEEFQKYLAYLDKIEDRVNSMKVPLDFSDHIYGLRQNIHFVRQRLEKVKTDSQKSLRS